MVNLVWCSMNAEWTMRNTLNKETPRDKYASGDKENNGKAVHMTMGWLDENLPAENGEFEDSAHELAADLAGGPPIAQKLTKRAMLRGWEDTEAGLEIESQAFGHLLNTEDLMEGITAFMGDSDPEFEGK